MRTTGFLWYIEWIMKQYVIDQLRFEDFDRLKSHLEDHFQGSTIEGIYWIPLTEEILSPIQAEHQECKPFYFALELVAPDRLSCELLVRTQSRMRCACIRYATKEQRSWLTDTVDAILEKLEISI